jgi:Asp-tRNA(Asn)/Glu-tRNA(Gln) amidotransferase A subunit family amidase
MEVSPGLPVGVSLVGAAQSDQALVDLARMLQA